MAIPDTDAVEILNIPLKAMVLECKHSPKVTRAESLRKGLFFSQRHLRESSNPLIK